jgi:hypothetical protein
VLRVATTVFEGQNGKGVNDLRDPLWAEGSCLPRPRQ